MARTLRHRGPVGRLRDGTGSILPIQVDIEPDGGLRAA
ncbi:hypothetical protein MYA_1848 [Burkholderia sp. KJ006]|nr:hypothetical protein MYA_1848 [Burkholderia sp. KJ006]